MSGICGVLDWDPSASGHARRTTALTRMLEGSAHLGPDGSIQYLDETVALGQFLDWQTPEARLVTAPVISDDGQTALVADVRLDNRAELADLMGLSPQVAAAWSDERFLLEAFSRFQIDFVERLLGDFFIAIWERSKRQLWLIRDQLGMRPAYYHCTDAGILFGSEVALIASQPTFSRRICRTRVADYVGLGFEDDTLTFYEGLLRLAPGTLLAVSTRQVEKRKYWELKWVPELRQGHHREYTEQFRAILVESVRCRLRCPGRIGFLLSGGLDSSSIVGIAKDSGLLHQQAIATFSALFTDYPLIDERTWIDQVTSTGQFDACFVRVDQRSPIVNVPSEIDDHGQPFYAPNNYVDSALLDCVKQAKIRVVLDGLDGDTVVGHGWEYLGELLRSGRWRRLWRLARQLDEHTDKSAAWFIWRHALGPTLAGALARVGGRRTIRTPKIMKRSFAEEIGWVDRVAGWRSSRGFDLLSDYRRQHWGKLRSGLMAMCFEVASHQAGARGLVRRHPYFDRRLVEFCVALPASQRLDRGVDRIIQRRAVEGFVPEAIRTRLTKSIWVQNFADRIALNDGQILSQWMAAKDSPVAEFCDMSVLRQNCNRILQRRADERTLAEIWVARALDVWLKMRW